MSDYWLELCEQQDRSGGIDVSRLRPGTLLEVFSKNTLYEIEVVAGREVRVKGGKFFPDWTDCFFSGSTWGGSMLKLGWVGYGMHMEFAVGPGKIVTTSSVRKARVIGDGWSYEMEWASRTGEE